MYPARLGGRNAKRLTVRSVTPADLSQTMGNTTQQMTAQPQDPNEVVDILVELDDEPAAAVLAAQSLTPGIAAAEKTAAKGVSRAFVAGSYTLPTVEQADTQALQVALATNQFTGKGMTIAVLDTGLDTAHPAFTNASADAKFTKDYVSGILQAADLNAEALMPGVTSDAVVLYTDADQYGDTKPVLDLGDDVAKNGSYDLTFHARNMGKDAAQYDVSVIAMSPAVLEQDGKTYMSSHDEALDVTVSGDKTVTLAAGATGDVKVSVSLSQSQKAKLDAAYENGIYVEGFVVLTAKDGSADLSIPFLAYYGDWSAPGMLDYATMLNEDTVPYSQLATELGAYFTSSFAYRLGANLFVTMDGAEKTSLKAEHITISPNGDTYMDGVELVNVSQMRNASALHFTVTNADGQEVWSDAVTNVPKTIYASSQGGPIPATMYQDMAPDAWYGTDSNGNALPDGQYYYTITADPVTDHESRNVRDTLTFPVYIDTQAPQLDQGCVTLSTGADGRTTLGMQVSDEHLYLDTEIFVANDDGTISTSSEKLLHKNVGLADMPDVTSDAMSVDVTDYAGKLLYVQLSDWGYNYAAYLVQLPDTFEGTTLSLSDTTAFLFTGEQQQLLAFDTDTDTALTWTSSNADVAPWTTGSGHCRAPGVTTVTATTANGASVSCVVGVSDQLTYTGLRLDFDEMTTTMYFDSTIDLPGVYLEPYGFALSGKHNIYGTEGLTWSVSDPTIADLDEYSKTTLVANKDGKSGDVTVTAEYQGMTASFTVHVGPYSGSVELYHVWIQARSNRIFLQGKQGIVGAGRDGIHATDTAATSDDQIITFTNSDPNVVDLTNPVIRATSNRDLPDECAFVDARNPGNAVITATATSTTQDTVQCFVTVVPKRYDGIQATQDTIHLKLGQGADLTQYLTLLDESGVVIPELNPVNYTSLDESILSVDESGHVTALHTGTGMVRALLNTGDYALIAVEVTCDHDHTTRTETPATCTEDGSVTVICDDCGEVLSTETLPATGHTTVVKNAKDATCTEPGYTGDKVCTVCGETVETGEVIPAAGHSYKDGKCTVCGAADPNANSGGNTGNNGTDSPNTADEAAMGLWLSLMTVAALAGAVLVLGKRYRA
ncbi:MAG: Fn3-like domain-containing protein [Dysosmobacter sp.]